MAGAGPVEPAQRDLSLAFPVYVASVLGSELRQAEILANVIQVYLAPESAERPIINLKTHPLAIIVSQDCDLEQDFNAKERGTTLPNILLCEIFEAARHEQRMKEQSKADVWRRIFQNQDYRYQYLRSVPAGHDYAAEGLPAMVVDFKRYFTVPNVELYARIGADTNRRCRLEGSYAQHFVQRFYDYQARIGIPVDHHR